MTSPSGILVVGAGSPNADMVAEALNANGFKAEWTDKIRSPSPSLIWRFGLVYGIYLQTCSRYIVMAKILRKKTIIHFVGSDAYWYARERSIWRRVYWRIVLRCTDLVIYVSPHLCEFVRRKGSVIPFPIASREFLSPTLLGIIPDRDILYYCPGGERNAEIYRLQWIIEYARQHPNEKITILGSITHPPDYKINLPNVEVVKFIERNQMPAFYRRHRRLIRMTSEDGLPRMLSEALLSGLLVTFNGKEVTEIPKERDPKEFAKSLLNALNTKFGVRQADKYVEREP